MHTPKTLALSRERVGESPNRREGVRKHTIARARTEDDSR